MPRQSRGRPSPHRSGHTWLLIFSNPIRRQAIQWSANRMFEYRAERSEQDLGGAGCCAVMSNSAARSRGAITATAAWTAAPSFICGGGALFPRCFLGRKPLATAVARAECDACDSTLTLSPRGRLTAFHGYGGVRRCCTGLHWYPVLPHVAAIRVRSARSLANRGRNAAGRRSASQQHARLICCGASDLDPR